MYESVKKLPVKAVISTLLILCVLFLAFSGALMYFGKTGMVWGISRSGLRAVHFWVAIGMCIFTAAHLVYNYRVYLAELRAIGRKFKIRK